MPSSSMRKDDAIRLRHMLDAAREAMAFCAARTRADLERDRQLLLAVVKDLEIVGEAASRVSEGAVAEWNRIPWQDIIGMRHRLIHGYFDVDVEIVWNTVQVDLRPLVVLLDEALSGLSDPA
jgi:uncharacterized protein with HEPN domain